MPPGQPGQPGQPGRPNVRTLQLPPQPTAPSKSAAAEEEEKKAKQKEEMCHALHEGAPGKINWINGLFMKTNDEKILQEKGIKRLLYWYSNEENECDPRNESPPLLAQVFNFALVVALLIGKGRKPIIEGLIKRKQTLMADITAAEALRADAEARLKKYTKDLKNIAGRRTELEEEYRAQAAIDKKRILKDAEEKRARMIKDAEFRVQQELRQAQGEITREAIDAAISAAEELIKKRVEQRDLDRLADDYLTGLGAAIKGPSTSTSSSSTSTSSRSGGAA